MKRTHTTNVIAVSMSLVTGAAVTAAFTGFSVDTDRPLFFGDFASSRLYANFDTADDRVVGVHCASADSSLPFYQARLGTWTEPNHVLSLIFPDLEYDTFLTVGLLTLQPGVSGTMITPGSQFEADGFLAGWSASSDAAFTHGPQVLLGQFTIEWDGSPVEIKLSMGLDWIDGLGETHRSCGAVIFGPLTPLPCHYPDRADLNHDCAIDGLDLALLLGAWGATCPSPIFAPCPSDLSCDGIVNGMDLAQLLGEWGTVPGCPWQR